MSYEIVWEIRLAIGNSFNVWDYGLSF